MLRLFLFTIAFFASLSLVSAQLAPQFPPGVFDETAAISGGTLVYTSSIIPFGAGTTSASTSALNYSGPSAGGAGTVWTSTENHASAPMAEAGTLRNLKVILNGNAGTAAQQGWDFTLRKGSSGGAPSDTILTCTVSGNGSVTPVVCDDDTDADAISFNQGDVFDIKACPSGLAGCTLSAFSAPSAVAAISISLTLVTTDGTMMLVENIPPALNATSADIFQGFSGNLASVTFGTGDITVSGLFSIAGQIDQICVLTSIAATGTGTITAALYHNGSVATNGLSTAISTSTHSGVWSCSNLSGTNTAETIAANDTASIRVTSNGTGASGYWVATARWKPTVAGLQPIFANGLIFGVPSAKFGIASGNLVAAASQTLFNGISPPYGSSNTKWTISNLTSAMSCASPPCQTSTMTRVINWQAGTLTPSTQLTCTMANGGTTTIGGVASTAFCNTGSTYNLTPGSIVMDYNTTVTNSAPATTWIKMGLSAQAIP